MVDDSTSSGDDWDALHTSTDRGDIRARSWFGRKMERDIYRATIDLDRAKELRSLLGDESNVWYADAIKRIARAQRQLDKLTRELVIIAINRKAITQRDAAGIVGVHENTIARWVKEEAQKGLRPPEPGSNN